MGNNVKIELLQILQRERSKYLSAAELSRLLGVSERTVYRQIKSLNKDLIEKEVEIISTPGLGYKLTAPLELEPRIDLSSTIGSHSVEYEIKSYVITALLNKGQVSVEEIISHFFISESVLYRMIASLNNQVVGCNAHIGIRKSNITFKGKNDDIERFFIGVLLSAELNHEDTIYSAIFQQKRYQKRKIDRMMEEKGDSLKSLSDFDYRILEWFVFIRLTRELVGTSGKQSNKQDIDDWFTRRIQELREINGNNTIDKIKNVVEASLSFLFSEDMFTDELFEVYSENLMKHLHTLIKQKLYCISVKNTLISTISTEYPLEYQVSGLIAYQLALNFSISLNSHDVGFLTLYLVAINRRSEMMEGTIPTIIVSSALSTGFLFREKVRNLIPRLDIFEVISEWEIDNHNFKNSRLIINMSQRDIVTDITVVKVSNPFSEEVIELLEDTVSNQLTIQNSPKDVVYYSIIDLKANKQEDAIFELLNTVLEASKNIEHVRKDILKREQIASTAIGNNVSVPHTIVSALQDTTVIVGRTTKPISWGADYVQVIILILFSENSVSQNQLFRKIYNFTRSKDNVQGILIDDSLTRFKSYLKGERYENY